MSQPVALSVVVDRFSPYPHIRIMEGPVPHPSPQDVLVEIAAAALNPIDIATATGLANGGKIYPNLSATFPLSLGWDMAGTIVEVGSKVMNWRVGDKVVAMVHQIASGFGVQASHVVVPAELLASWPPTIPATHIAALPLAGLTAYQAIQALRLKPNETVLINGPLGAVGSIATQLATLAEAKVVGIVRSSEFEIAANLGITVCIGRGKNIAKAAQQLNLSIDAALDVVGGDTALQTLSAVRNNGRYVTLIPHIGLGLPTPQRGIVQQNVLIVPDAVQLGELIGLAETGKLKFINEPTIISLQNAQHAYDLMTRRRSHKKIILVNDNAFVATPQ